jgi:hypothetical protein
VQTADTSNVSGMWIANLSLLFVLRLIDFFLHMPSQVILTRYS